MPTFTDAITQQLYAQLVEEATANETVLLFGGGAGAAYRQEIKGRGYWYWQARDGGGHLRRLYLGPDTAATVNLVRQLEQRKTSAAEAKQSLAGLVRAFVATGGMANQPEHFRVMDALGSCGLLSKGAVLVGSHAFVALGNALGVRWDRGHYQTTDVDFARSIGISVAVPLNTELRVDVPEAIFKLEQGYFLVPELDSRKPSTSIKSNRTRVKIDFLTSAERGDTTPIVMSDLNIAAAPLRSMDYLLSGSLVRGVVIGSHAIPVILPDPSRFALHKLVISRERTLDRDVKSKKDVRQAAELMACLMVRDVYRLDDALDAARGTPGMPAHLIEALPMVEALNPEAAGWLRKGLGEH